jgi:hypothetical protein
LRRLSLTIVWVSSSRGLRAEHVLEHARHGCNGDTMVDGRERRWKEMKCGAKAGLAVSGPTKSPGGSFRRCSLLTNLRTYEPPAIRRSDPVNEGLGRLAAVKSLLKSTK